MLACVHADWVTRNKSYFLCQMLVIFASLLTAHYMSANIRCGWDMDIVQTLC